MSYVAHADILNKIGINLGLLDDLLQQRVDYEVKICVLESSLLGLRQRRPNSKSNHDIVRVLGCAGKTLSSACGSEALLRTVRTYIAASPVLPGVRCDRIEPSLWEAILYS